MHVPSSRGLFPALFLLATGVAAAARCGGVQGSEPAEIAAQAAPPPVALDLYGGVNGAKVADAGCCFRLVKRGDRWLFATPLGNAYWLRSVYAVNWSASPAYKQLVDGKYRRGEFYAQAVKRLRAWGFNGLGEYSDLKALPVGTYNSPPTNPERLPFVATFNATLYGIRSGRFHNVYAAIAPSLGDVYRGIFPDVFDPDFAPWVEALIRDDEHVYNGAAALNASPWLIGLTTDDGDYTTGFGPGPDAQASQQKTHPHLGWVAAVASPSIEKAELYGQAITNPDARLHAKYAFRDFLRARYGSVAALNEAWAAKYTTWDSAGGWPGGTGVLDESGRSRWIGADHDVTTRAPRVKADLDAFLKEIADRYFAAYAAAVRKHLPNHLLFSPATMQAGTRVPILEGAAPHLDAVQSSGMPLGPSYPLFKRIHEVTARPVFVWTTFTAQADAALTGHNLAGWGPAYNKATQRERGAAYATELANLFALRAGNGDAFVVGIEWWEWADRLAGGENMNFGLVTLRDNAYDGRESTVPPGTDAWGYPTGLEARDYGDFLTAARGANQAIDQSLAAAGH